MSEPNKVLLIEPDPDLAKEYLALLDSWGLGAARVGNHLQGLSCMEDGSFDAVLVSMEPGGIEGSEFCKLVRNREKMRNKAYTGLILLGENRHLETIVSRCSGADDFLIKPFLQAEMKWRILNCLDKVGQLRQLRDYLRRTPEDNRFDTSRLHLFLKQIVKREMRKSSRFSILLMELKGFELAELGYGPVTVLNLEEHLLDHLGGFLRSDDQIGKLGKGRYCVLASDLQSSGLKRLKDRVEKGLSVSLGQEYAYLDLELRLQGLTVALGFDFSTDLEIPVSALVEWLLKWADGQIEVKGLEPVQLTKDGLCPA
ncbi:MAG: response regulator [Desulfohalobiaceae bacterium]|nr:response regulator [Desulfohalobiaceae bacterium]